MALILPTSFNYEKSAGWVFTSLQFTPYLEPFEFGEDSAFYTPMLEYLHDIPQGYAEIELSPGTYRMAVAFILAALPSSNDDFQLYPGVTGGGFSNEFQEITIEAGKTLAITVELTDENGWGWLNELACR